MTSNIHSFAIDESFSQVPVLITGGLGFIGSNLAHTLVNAGAIVTVVDNLYPHYGGNMRNVAGVEKDLCLNICDIRDERRLRELVQDKKYLFSLAAQTSHMDSMTDPRSDLEINVQAQLSILEACRQQNPDIKVVFASTRQVYGTPDYLPVDENHPLRPVDVNGINKMSAEWYHLLYFKVYGLRTCVLRLTNTYGPRMRIKDARQTFVGIWIRQILEGKPFEVWEGQQKRDFTYVNDAVRAFLLAAVSKDANGKIYNLGGEAAFTLKEVASCLLEVNGSGTYDLKSFPADRKRIDIGDYYANFNLIKQELDWSPQVTLRDGISQTLDYYRSNIDHYI